MTTAQSPLPLAAALGVLADLPTRRAVLRERICGDPLAAAPAIDALLRSAMGGSASGRAGALALASTLLGLRDEGAVGILAALRDAAHEQGLSAVASLLRDPPPARALAKGGRLAEVCLPERHDLRFWALSRERDLVPACQQMLRIPHLPQVLAHPSPIFIGRVLRQRWIRLRDVLFIASRRPTSEAIVLEIVRQERWLQRIEVREAIVMNPFAPPAVALYLLPSTRYPVLRRLRDTGEVHPDLERAAASLLRLRCGQPSQGS